MSFFASKRKKAYMERRIQIKIKNYWMIYPIDLLSNIVILFLLVGMVVHISNFLPPEGM
jgi:hypothetical protein